MMKLKQYILVSTYLRRLKKRLHYPHKLRKTTIKGLRGFICERILAGDQVHSMKDLYVLFGTLESSSEQWMELISSEEYKKYKKELRTKRAVLISFSAILLIISIFIIWNYISIMQNEIVYKDNGIISESGTLPVTGEKIQT